MKTQIQKPAVKPADFLIFFLVLGASILLLNRTFSAKRGKVLVNANGTQYEFALSKDGVFSVMGAIGITQFEIKDRKVHVLSSPCPNKTCVAQGFSDILVCLPNNVIIQRISESSEEGLDAISQ